MACRSANSHALGQSDASEFICIQDYLQKLLGLSKGISIFSCFLLLKTGYHRLPPLHQKFSSKIFLPAVNGQDALQLVRRKQRSLGVNGCEGVMGSGLNGFTRNFRILDTSILLDAKLPPASNSIENHSGLVLCVII